MGLDKDSEMRRNTGGLDCAYARYGIAETEWTLQADGFDDGEVQRPV